jgi:cytochrome c5
MLATTNTHSQSGEASDGTNNLADTFNPEQVYKKNCVACHATGASDAPILGDKQAWSERIANGMDVLLASTLYGLNGTMPAKGLCFDCSEEQLKAVIQYMIDKSQ